MLSTELNVNNGRIASVDLLRGLAALGVVFFHYTAETTIHLSDNNFLRIVGVHGHLGVEVFFVISGFVISFSMFKNGYRIALSPSFLLKRVIRIEIPYLALIATEVVLILMSSWTPWREAVSSRLELRTILLNIGYVSGFLNEPWLIPAFWTLAIEFQFYILMALLFPLLSSQKFLVRASALGGLLVIHFLVASPNPNLFFHHAPFFLVGIVLYQLSVKLIGSLECMGWLAFLLLSIFLQSNFTYVATIVITILLVLYYKGPWAWANFLGMISYSIYLIHIPFGGRILLLTNRFVNSELLKSTLIIVIVLLTVFAAWIFFILVEKPSLILSKKVKNLSLLKRA